MFRLAYALHTSLRVTISLLHPPRNSNAADDDRCRGERSRVKCPPCKKENDRACFRELSRHCRVHPERSRSTGAFSGAASECHRCSSHAPDTSIAETSWGTRARKLQILYIKWFRPEEGSLRYDEPRAISRITDDTPAI